MSRRCTTHHEACACREEAHRNEIACLAAENADLKRERDELLTMLEEAAAKHIANLSENADLKRLLAEAEGAIGYADRLPIAPGQDALWPTLPAVRRAREREGR